MFKKTKLFFTVIISTALIFTGCHKKSDTTDAKGLLRNAVAQLQQAENYEVNKHASIKIATDENDQMTIAVDTDLKVQQVPKAVYQIDMANNVTVGNETQEFNTQEYVEQSDNGSFVLYANTSGTWTQEVIGQDAQLQDALQNPVTALGSYLQNDSSVSYIGKKSIDGIGCDMISVVIDQSSLPSIIKQLGLLKSMGMDEEEALVKLKGIKDIEDIELNIYINRETGSLLREEIDLSNAMEEIIAGTEGIMIEQIDDFDFVFQVDYSHTGELENISVPDEAKAAQEK